MHKYLIHVPVFGSLDLVVDAKNEQEVIDMYLEQKNELLKFNDSILVDDFESAYIVPINDKPKC